MVKAFISQPMRDKTNEEIESERAAAVARIKEICGDDVEVIDSFFKDAPHDAKPLWFLGKSLELLSTADVAFFCRDFEDARGCRIEFECCYEYGIHILR
jgi:hypothetical protein